MDPLAVIVTGIWAMLPAYIPNNLAVLAGGGAPIDGGRSWRGARILGDGKTWRGTAVGVLGGVLVGVILNAVHVTVVAAIDIPLPTFPIPVIFALSAGAMLGDILASFIKRRTGRARGSAFPGLDQLDFVVVSLVMVVVVAPGWFVSVFTLPVLAVVLVLTPALHVGTNVIAYWLGLKEEPW